MELVRESVRVRQVVSEGTAQTVVESDIIVPDVKPDIVSILIVDGDALANNIDVAQDRVLISGMIRFKILYISDNPEQNVKSINTGAGFSYSMDMDNVRSGMKARAECSIEHIDYNILNGRKINIKTILNISCRAYNEIEQFFAKDLRGIDNVQTLFEKVEIKSYLGEFQDKLEIKENLDIPAGKPAIREILQNDIKIRGKEYKIADNRLLVKGELGVATLYIGDDERQGVQFTENEIPFTHFIDIPGIDEGTACEIEINIADCRFEVAEDSDGEMRAINSEILLNILADMYSRKEIEVLSDAYSPFVRLDLDRESFRVEEMMAESESQAIVRDTVRIDESSFEIAEIYNVLSTPVLLESRVADDRLLIEGVVNNRILYLAESQDHPVCCFEQEMPFKHSIDIRGLKQGVNCDIDLEIEHCNYNVLSARELELRLAVGIRARPSSSATLSLISKIIELPMDEKRMASQPSITIYFAQPGDTLWKIAKRYLVTVNDVKHLNNLTDRDQINPGQQIIIPKRA